MARGAVVSRPRGARSRGFPTPASRGAASSLAWQRAGSRRGRRCWNNETEHAGPGESLAEPNNPGEGAPAWKSPSAAVLILIWGLGWGIWEEGKQSCDFQPSAPPRLGIPYSGQPYGWHCSLIFTFWRYWAHDSAPGRGEGKGEARPSVFTPRVGGRRSRRRRRESAMMQEKSQPRPLCCFRLGSGQLVGAGWASFSALSSQFLQVIVLNSLPS